MGGSNPYIEEVKYKPATKKFKVTFLPSGKTMEVDPEKIPCWNKNYAKELDHQPPRKFARQSTSSIREIPRRACLGRRRMKDPLIHIESFGNDGINSTRSQNGRNL